MSELGGMLKAHLFPLLFYLYAFAGAPLVRRAFDLSLHGDKPKPLLGILLFTVLILETVGLRWKSQALKDRALPEAFARPISGLGYAAGIMHVLLVIFLGITALDTLGVMAEGYDDGAQAKWLGIAFCVLLAKETVLMFLLAGEHRPGRSPAPWKETAADVFLLVFGCIAYTAFWESLIAIGEFDRSNLIVYVVETLAVGLIFLIIYLPIRVPYLMEERYLGPAQGKKARLWFAMGMGVLMGLYPML